MSFVSTKFSYNNMTSDSMGVMLVKMDDSPITQAFSSVKTIVTEHVRFKNTFNYGSDRNTYTISIKIIKVNGNREPFTMDERMELMRLLCPDDGFHPFTSEDFPNINFFVQFSKTQFVNLGNNTGYYELEAESNAPYPLVEEMNFSNQLNANLVTFKNKCNTDLYFTPNCLTFTLINSATSFTLTNLTTGGKVLSFTGLDLLETISINSNQEIISSTGKERVSNFNFGFDALEMCYGINNLQISDNCEVLLQTQFPIQM